MVDVSRDPRWRAIRPSGEDFDGDTHPAMVTLRTGMPEHNVLMGVETPVGDRRWISINSYPAWRDERGVQQVVTVFREVEPAHVVPSAAPAHVL